MKKIYCISTNGIEQVDVHIQKSLNLNFSSFIKISSKWILDLNVKHRTVNLIKYNTEESR